MKKPVAKKPAAGETAAAEKPAPKKKAAPKKKPVPQKRAAGTGRRTASEVQAAKQKKPASATTQAAAAAPAPADGQSAVGQPATDGPGRRRSSKFNPTAVVKPLKKKSAVVHTKYKVPVGRRAASRQAGDAAAPAAAAPLVRPDDGFSAEQLRKVKTGLSKKQIAAFRDQLHEHRRRLVEDVAGLNASRGHDDGDSHVPLHMADVGSENYEREFNLMLQESDHRLLVDIDDALARIDAGTYGVCLDTCTPIGLGRLEYKPWARYGIEAARRGRLGRGRVRLGRREAVSASGGLREGEIEPWTRSGTSRGGGSSVSVLGSREAAMAAGGASHVCCCRRGHGGSSSTSG